MTTHYLDHDHYTVAIGWDAALDTFFACIEDPTADEDEAELLLWLGSLPGEYRALETFRADFERQVQDKKIAGLSLTDEVAELLQADYAASPPGTGMAGKSEGYQDFLTDWFHKQ